MALTLADVLAHPALQHSHPRVLAGEPSARTVRWVHSSEVYAIAPLLRGGELLLTTGLGLLGRRPEELTAYVRGLADRQLAGLALELGLTFDRTPDALVEEARRCAFPLLELRRIYPFVEVTEQVNSAILESSVTRLRHADEVGRALSRVLAERGGLDGLARTLAALLRRSVILTDASGTVLVAVEESDLGTLVGPDGSRAAVISGGVVVGELRIGPGDAGDDLVRAALDRAPEVFALEMLRGPQRPLLLGRERQALLERMLAGERDDPGALEAHAALSRLGRDVVWAGVAMGPAAPGSALRGNGLRLLQDAARAAEVGILAGEVAERAYALLAFPGDDADASWARVRDALAEMGGPVSAMGPVVGPQAAGRSLRAAHHAMGLELAAHHPSAHVRVRVATALVPARVLSQVSDRTVVLDLVEEQLGALLHSPRSQDLLRTLEVFLDNGGAKAATARALSLRRQSVHDRLERLESALGCDLADPVARLSLQLALAARGLASTVRPGPG